MSLARYLSKLGALLGSDGKVPMSGLSGILAKGQLPAGTVLQVVQGTTTTVSTKSGSTYEDTGLSATITPSSASSKILVLVHQSVETYASNATHMGLKIQRNGTDILRNDRVWGDNTNAANDLMGTASLSVLDSPATTSAVVYKTQYAATVNNTGSYGNYVAVQPAGSVSPSMITLMEIAG